MMLAPGSRVLFCDAAGPRVGFGHVSRSRALARALGVPFVVALRGTPATRRAVRALGARVVPPTAEAVERERPHLMVVDDPRRPAARRWLAIAARAGVPVASVHDLGIGLVRSDLVIDGSVGGRSRRRRADLAGPVYAILDPSIADLRRRALARVPKRVLVALGGGAHVLRFGRALAAGICDAIPGVEVLVASGFSAGRRPELPERGRWILAARGLATELATCSVAVLGGGITLYEACALGTPAVTVSVVPSQRPTVSGFAAAGAAVNAGSIASPGVVARVAAAVEDLMSGRPDTHAMARRARALVDGRGAFRVATRLAALVAEAEDTRDAA